MREANLKEISNRKLGPIKFTLLVVWILLLSSPFLNVLLDIGVGKWHSDGTFGIDKRLRMASSLILFIVFCYTSVTKIFLRKIHPPSFTVLLCSTFLLMLYILSSILHGYGLSSEHLRLSLYLFVMGLTILGSLDLVLSDFIAFFRIFSSATLVFFILQFDNIFLIGIFSNRLGIGVVDPNYLSAIIGLGLVYPLMVVLTSNELGKIILATLAITLIILLKLLTGSSGGSVSIVVSFIVMIVMLKGKPSRRILKYVAFAIVLPTVCLAFLLPDLFSASFSRVLGVINNDSEIMVESVDSRLYQYQRFADLFLQNNISYLIGISAENITDRIGQELHNSFLRPMLAGGIFAFLLFIVVNGYVAFLGLRTVRHFRRSGSRDEYVFSVLLISFFLGWCLQSLTVPQETLAIFWAFFSIILLLNRSSKRDYFKITYPNNLVTAKRY